MTRLKSFLQYKSDIKRPSIKDVRRQAKFVQCGHFTDKGGISDADVRTFWCKKTLNFSKFMVWRWLSLFGHYADKGSERVNFFAILCGRVLWTALNHRNKYKKIFAI